MTRLHERPGTVRRGTGRQLLEWLLFQLLHFCRTILASRSECDSATVVADRGRPSVRTLLARATCQLTPPNQYDPVSVRGAP